MGDTTMSKLYIYPENPPDENTIAAFRFIDDLCRPVHERCPVGYDPAAVPPDGSLSLTQGIDFIPEFPDPQNNLETAYADFQDFLRVTDLKNGKIPLKLIFHTDLDRETHTVDITPNGICLTAGDTEGIRRGLVWIEDEICRSGGPWLKIGSITRRAVICTRISRCFYGPIKRPPANRDELADDIDYYPDNYLNRLAHDGTNGLWLTISLRELLPSKIVPEFQPGEEGRRKLEKLRRTVRQCLRYGIKIYAFMIEPRWLDDDEPAALNNPEICGLHEGRQYAFCTSSEQGKAYLHEAFTELFCQVPGLGGVIDITVGERMTHCWSGCSRENRGLDWDGTECPRCKDMEPAQVLKSNLEIIEKAIHGVDPDAEFISWPYSQCGIWGEEKTEASAALTPSGVCHCFNFETSGRTEQLGKTCYAGDYWLSYIGPSQLYRRIADAVPKKKGARLFAKIQVGCSHEVATVPFVPVPSKLYYKYKAMHELGVSGAMQCWYFGSYPSAMTKAAGELSFTPFPESEDAFLAHLAKIRWGKAASAVVRAWKYFSEGYGNYPVVTVMGYYGPMHDGPVWPLYLEPANRPLSPSWRLTYSTSGDRIGESFYYLHSLNDILYLTGEMTRLFDMGDAVLESLDDCYREDPDCAGDLRVCRALTLQFKSANNIFHFYALREEMAFGCNVDRISNLNLMREIVLRERAISEELCDLCEQDGRLGFHSEAEGYKYHPAKLRWRIAQLDTLLSEDFPALRKRLEEGLEPFPEYCGESPEYKNYHAPYLENNAEVWNQVPERRDFVRDENSEEDFDTAWQAFHNGKTLFFRVRCKGGDARDRVELRMEPRSLWWYPATIIDRNGIWRAYEPSLFEDYGLTERDLERHVTVRETSDGWETVAEVPLTAIWRDDRRNPLRLNILRRRYDIPGIAQNKNEHSKEATANYVPRGGVFKWVRRDPIIPEYPRLIYTAQNTQEVGYLVFDD
jgi:hypothetical protein